MTQRRVSRSGSIVIAWSLFLVLAVVAEGGTDRARAGLDDDLTFRPTVIVRKGRAQGSGTVIASMAGETLVLTARHVVSEEAGSLLVEFHRYNLGVERFEPEANWPRAVPAEVVATDPAADLAVVRLRTRAALPYVARLAPPERAIGRGAIVTSVGIDLGTHLSSWVSRVTELAWLELEHGGDERPFLVTSRPPEHGRSGGGLFLQDGSLVGVCIGRTEIVKGRRAGLFAATASIHRLLRDHDLDASVNGSSPPGKDGNRVGAEGKHQPPRGG